MKNGSETRESKTPDTTFIKNYYYAGKLLRASDFLREQAYVNQKLQFINRSFHGYGIIEGLDVQMGGDGVLSVSAGSAIDPLGRILIVPLETKVTLKKLVGLREIPKGDFILGIRYTERVMEKESSYLEPDKPCRWGTIEESYELQTYACEDWKKLKASEDQSRKTLTKETVLFRNTDVELVVVTPAAVPSDSIFKCRIQARVLIGGGTHIRWQCMAKLQGAFFAESGQAVRMLEGEEPVLSGSVMREWEICTEENRKGPVTLELTELRIKSGDFDVGELEPCRIMVETAPSHEEIVRKYLWQEETTERQETDWLPLAYIKAAEPEKGEQGTFVVSGEQNVRSKVFCPAWEQVYRREAERSGIADIQWGGLRNTLRRAGQSQQEQPRYQIQDMIREKLEEQRKQCIRRGIAVIPIPRHYRKGRILLSEEIAHGFPGEEVLIWCGRAFEEKNYAYWSRDKMRYFVLCGEESLFSDSEDSGWKIRQQAIRQNVEDGTFQVALTLSKGRRRNRDREVAISWIAVKPGWAAEAIQAARTV